MSDALRALLFDFDGTIAETERDGHRVAYNAAFEELGLPWRWSIETYGALLRTAGGKERLAAFIARERPDLESGRVTALTERIHDTKRRHFAGIALRLTFRPGVVRLVREAQSAGLMLAIATTAAPDGVDAVLRRDAAFAAAFSTIAAGDVVAQKKPAPDIFTYALARLGCDAAAAFAFEDSAIGLLAARAAGLTTLVTPSVYTSGEAFPGAAAVLSDLGERAAPALTLAGLEPPGGIVDVAYVRELAQLPRGALP